MWVNGESWTVLPLAQHTWLSPPPSSSVGNVLVGYQPFEALDGLCMVVKCFCAGVCRGQGQFIVSIGYTHGSFLPTCPGAASPPCTPLGASQSPPLTSIPVSLRISWDFLLPGTGEGRCLISSPGQGFLPAPSFFSCSFPPHTATLHSYFCPRWFQSPSLSAPCQDSHSSHTFSFCLGCESFRHLWQEGQSPGGGIVMLGEANSYRARPLMKR